MAESVATSTPDAGERTPRIRLRGLRKTFGKVVAVDSIDLDIDDGDEKWRWFRPCLLHSIHQCTAPCNFRVTREEYRKQIRALRMVLEAKPRTPRLRHPVRSRSTSRGSPASPPTSTTAS